MKKNLYASLDDAVADIPDGVRIMFGGFERHREYPPRRRRDWRRVFSSSRAHRPRSSLWQELRLNAACAQPAPRFRYAQIMLEQRSQVRFVVHIHLQPGIAAHQHRGIGLLGFGKMLRETSVAKM